MSTPNPLIKDKPKKARHLTKRQRNKLKNAAPRVSASATAATAVASTASATAVASSTISKTTHMVSKASDQQGQQGQPPNHSKDTKWTQETQTQSRQSGKDTKWVQETQTQNGRPGIDTKHSADNTHHALKTAAGLPAARNKPAIPAENSCGCSVCSVKGAMSTLACGHSLCGACVDNLDPLELPKYLDNMVEAVELHQSLQNHDVKILFDSIKGDHKLKCPCPSTVNSNQQCNFAFYPAELKIDLRLKELTQSLLSGDFEKALQEKLDNLNKKIAEEERDQKKMIEMREAVLEAARKKAEYKVKEEISKLKKEQKNLKEEIDELEKALKALDDDKVEKKLQDKIDSVNSKIDDKRKKEKESREAVDTKIEKLEAENEQLRKENAALEKQLPASNNNLTKAAETAESITYAYKNQSNIQKNKKKKKSPDPNTPATNAADTASAMQAAKAPETTAAATSANSAAMGSNSAAITIPKSPKPRNTSIS